MKFTIYQLLLLLSLTNIFSSRFIYGGQSRVRIIMKFIIISLVALACVVHCRLPDGLFPKCIKNDPNLHHCLLESVEKIRPMLLDGIPEIDFPGLEPFYLEKIDIDLSSFGFAIKGEATDIHAHGFGDFKIFNFTIDYKTETAKVFIEVPRVDISASYATSEESKLFFLRPTSSGKFTGTFFDIVGDVDVRGRLDDESKFDGPIYLRIPYVDLVLSFGKDSTFKITPSESNILGKVLSYAVNFAPKRLMLRIFKAKIGTAISRLIKKYANRVLDEIPFEDMFEDVDKHGTADDGDDDDDAGLQQESMSESNSRNKNRRESNNRGKSRGESISRSISRGESNNWGKRISESNSRSKSWGESNNRGKSRSKSNNWGKSRGESKDRGKSRGESNYWEKSSSESKFRSESNNRGKSNSESKCRSESNNRGKSNSESKCRSESNNRGKSRSRSRHSRRACRITRVFGPEVKEDLDLVPG